MPGFYGRDHEMHLLPPAGAKWRDPQRGALAALVAHWTRTVGTGSLVSLPTGTGKTAVAMGAPFLMRTPPNRVLVLVPSRALRSQIHQEFSSQHILQKLRVLDSEGTDPPEVMELSGRVEDWNDIADADVVVALPRSISPHYYEDSAAGMPPTELFDLLVVDEAHHTPAATWRAVLNHFAWRRALLLTATPMRRDGKRVPGELIYHYPLRRALEEGLYNPVEPVVVEAPEPFDRQTADRQIAHQVIELMDSEAHDSSTLIIRGRTIRRLLDLAGLYTDLGLEAEALHNRLGETTKQDILDRLRGGQLRAVAVAGMLGEGFDLPSLRIAAYHDKHKSLPATIQLIGRLARVSAEHPQSSYLVTVADQDIYPSLQGAVRRLYDEDEAWSEVLPGLIDEHVADREEQAAFVRAFSESADPAVDLRALAPLVSVAIYELPDDYEPAFATGHVPAALERGAEFTSGRVVYAGTHQQSRLLVLVSEHLEQPRWSSDPAMASRDFKLHLLAFRPGTRGAPGLLFVNTSEAKARSNLLDAVELPEQAGLVNPDRINDYLDRLERSAVSAVGVRTTTMGGRDTSYRNVMGSRVDRGLRRADTAGGALGHVILQFSGPGGSPASGGAAMEKAKLWATKYVPLVEYDRWIDKFAEELQDDRSTAAGRFLPQVDRGHRLETWPDSRPLLADMNAELWDQGWELEHSVGRVPIEQVDLYVARDPLGLLSDELPAGGALHVVAVTATQDGHELVWQGYLLKSGGVAADEQVVVQRGETTTSFRELLATHPPTIYFLDGTTVVGTTCYESRHSLGPFNPHELEDYEWPDVDLKAEIKSTAKARGRGISIHEALERWLLSCPRRGDRRWLLCNDGSGEIADYLLIEELPSGELHLGLWHAKSSKRAKPGLRIDDLQELIAQAVRSRRHFSRADLWQSVAARLEGQESPSARYVEDSEDGLELLRDRLGLTEEPDDPPASWPETTPRIRAQIGIVQPGLSKSQLIQAVQRDNGSSFVHLFTIAMEAAELVDGELTVLVSR